MKSPNDILNTLGGLSRQDRDWIVNRLSPQARKTLLDGAMEQVIPPIATSRPMPSPEAPTDPQADLLQQASVERLVLVLRQEPAWVAHCVLCLGLPCTAELRASLEAVTRMQVERLESSGVNYPRPIQERIRNALRDALQRLPAVHIATPSAAKSRWTGMWAGMTARLAAQRMRLSA